MKTTSIYAQGPAKIEVGKFGGDLAAAVEWFTNLCKKHKVVIKEVADPSGGGKFFRLDPNTGESDTYDLLHEVANIMDLHSDPPFRYLLIESPELKPGEYVKTGAYND